jgi:uncharacterized protein with GYD domain
MATYILLLSLTPDGQEAALSDPEYLLRVEEAIDLPGVQPLGLYGVLGDCDFVTIVEAESNERMARFSLELGVRAKVHIKTMPAVPISHLRDELANPLGLTATAGPEPEGETSDTPLTRGSQPANQG